MSRAVLCRARIALCCARIALCWAVIALSARASVAQDPGDRVVPAPPPELEVTAFASAGEVMIGERFVVFVNAVHPDSITVNLPSSLQLGERFTLHRREMSDRVRPDGMRVREFELELIAWDVGELELPPIPVTYAIGGAVESTLTRPVPIRVIGLISGEDVTPRDITGPVAVFRRDATLAYVAAGILAVLIVVLLGARALRGRQVIPVRSGPRQASRPLSAREEALARLAALDQSGALAQSDRKPAFVEMSEIFRKYLQRVFGVPALDLTTAEIKLRIHNALLDRGRDSAAFAPLCAWLDRCALVKYAGASATEQEARQTLYDACQLIEQISEENAAAAAASASAPAAASATAAASRAATAPASTSGTATAAASATAAAIASGAATAPVSETGAVPASARAADTTPITDSMMVTDADTVPMTVSDPATATDADTVPVTVADPATVTDADTVPVTVSDPATVTDGDTVPVTVSDPATDADTVPVPAADPETGGGEHA